MRPHRAGALRHLPARLRERPAQPEPTPPVYGSSPGQDQDNTSRRTPERYWKSPNISTALPLGGSRAAGRGTPVGLGGAHLAPPPASATVAGWQMQHAHDAGQVVTAHQCRVLDAGRRCAMVPAPELPPL